MPLYRKLKSLLGYQNLPNSSLDSYGVDHSGFTTRDELEYQFARQDREDLLMNQEKQNGVTDNFTQYGHNFWGTPSENNYGFGSSNISENIERLKKQFMTPNSSLSENNLLNNPSGYQSLLSDNGADNFLDESNSYPTSNYNSLTLSNPQSRIQTSLRTPAPTSLTGGLNQNSFDSSSNNFSYPNALGTGGGTSTERMAATLSARETPYNSLSGEETSSMSELSGNSYNSSLSSGFSNNNVPQNEPLWQKLNSLSNTQLNKLTSLIKKAKDEERLYGSSPTKQSLFNLFFGIQQAHAGTLSSMGIENDPIAFKPNSYDFYSQEYTDLIDEIYPDLQFYEGTVKGAYPDSKYLI
ncbi:MAG: hypothetical protein IKL90_06425, partial [Alphaproteobacteria bacterium]|nr:hypothetical protein [Alphaproteobacteria bacterium]